MSTSLILRTVNYGLWRIIGFFAFNRVKMIHRDKLPESGPVLFVATHRNGALDAAAYRYAIPRAVPMISVQLHRSLLGRLLFSGIPVARAKDRSRGMQWDNQKSMDQCIAVLQAGGQLCVMPEGTSTLGHVHLPYRRGAARVVHAAIQAGVKLKIVPLAVHYEDPTAWQSRVEVLIGDPVCPADNDHVAAIHTQIVQALESVGANFVDAAAQAQAETLANTATLGTGYSFAQTLKRFEPTVAPALLTLAQHIEQLAQNAPLRLHQGVPLYPLKSCIGYVLVWLLLLPVISGCILLNAPVLIAGYLAAQILPDEKNVIAFWRMVVGLAAGLFWMMLLNVLIYQISGVTAVALYGGITLVGVKCWYRFRKLSVALFNKIRHRAHQSEVMQSYWQLLDYLTYE
jgi:hypothetical protein